MTNLCDKIMGKIKQDQVEPKPRWHFLLHNSVVWGVVGVSTIVGSAAFSIILFKVMDNGHFVLHETHGRFTYLFMTLPYIWIVLLVMFSGIAIFHIRHTKDGYKYGATTLLLGSLAVSMTLGTLLHIGGMARHADTVLQTKAPRFQRTFDTETRYWNKPQDGRIIGVIKTVDSPSLFLLDAYGRVWRVDASAAKNDFNIVIKKGAHVRVLGEQVDDQQFLATHIAPLRKPAGFKVRLHKTKEMHTQ